MQRGHVVGEALQEGCTYRGDIFEGTDFELLYALVEVRRVGQVVELQPTTNKHSVSSTGEHRQPRRETRQGAPTNSDDEAHVKFR